MAVITDIQRDVATVALGAAAKDGFALAGGCALLVYAASSRPTKDVDLFTDQEYGVAQAADAVEQALAAAGLTAERVERDWFGDMDYFLAEWEVTAPGGERVILQLAYLVRAHPVVLKDIGPVLDQRDVFGGKVCALINRHEVRDFIDTSVLMSQGWPMNWLIAQARELDPGIDDEMVADVSHRVDLISDGEFARYGLNKVQIAYLRKQFSHWPR